ncbi:MAG: hypothetical protein NTW46_00620 [Candidatus Nealsonbacteria bacterium]|nr:hypothetical protein [Candidatus Nealsonbacteria bacterium]
MKVREAKNSLDLFNLLSKNKLIYVELKSEFISHIRKLVLNKYKTFKNFNKIFLKISYPVVKHEFKKARYHSFVRWIKTIESFKINRQDFFGNIVGFRINGSHKKGPIFLKRDIIIDEKFVEGYALYIAEGDTGLSGKKVPKKLRFTNSNLEVVNFFVDWVNTYFPNNFFYLDVIFPSGLYPENNFSELIAKKLSLDIGRIKIRHDRYNKKIKYRVCLGSAIIIGLVLSMDKLIKKLSEKNKSLAVGYIRGIMA